jgi:predicted secreted protein
MLNPVLNLAIFFVWWWIVLFAILPIGVRSLDEEGIIAKGHDQGAPAAPDLKTKALWTTVAAAALWAITAAFIAFDPFNVRPELGF